MTLMPPKPIRRSQFPRSKQPPQLQFLPHLTADPSPISACRPPPRLQLQSSPSPISWASIWESLKGLSGVYKELNAKPENEEYLYNTEIKAKLENKLSLYDSWGSRKCIQCSDLKYTNQHKG
uniref:Uncharacterized protein n=1 Tax=Lactuca sativa TaxID=4236 RepID=A0A9R1VME5_LACSA|nr:hypothetical protein LSAT_V11C500283100 [Lactuca sativa]